MPHNHHEYQAPGGRAAGHSGLDRYEWIFLFESDDFALKRVEISQDARKLVRTSVVLFCHRLSGINFMILAVDHVNQVEALMLIVLLQLIVMIAAARLGGWFFEKWGNLQSWVKLVPG